MSISTVVFWGIFGMIVEICFTAIRGLVLNRKLELVGHTSLWMFPIYGFGLSYGFDFVIDLIKTDYLRYLTYPLWIWAVEIVVGLPALYFGIRLWDYHYLPVNLHWRGVISFFHYPFWCGLGIIVEAVK
jgi:uncharacterized membrane protein